MQKAFRNTAAALALAACSLGSQAAHWALSGDLGVHDPAITKEGSTWWTFSTGAGIQVLYSGNGTAWSRGVQIFSKRPSWWSTYVPGHSGLDVWAPDVQTYNGRVWLYYSISTFGSNTSAIGLVSASSIAKGDWRDDGKVISTKSGSNDYNAIDPNLTFDASGNPYLVFGSWFSGIKITKLDKSTMKPTGSLTTLAKRSNGIEAPVIVYRDGYYYLFVSIDKCCAGTSSTYKIAYGRSTSITGPYLDKNGKKMTDGYSTVMDSGNSRWVGPGGQDILRDSSNSVIARHAYDASNGGAPTLMISDLKFSSGWPTY
ncbi:MAG: glycoside hydrolase family 43 protein [Rhodocyclaceae bacterium]